MIKTASFNRRAFAGALAAASLLAACGSVDKSPSSADASPAPTATSADGDSAATSGGGGLIGYVVAGDRNDGGFYQGQVKAVEAGAAAAGYKLVVVDKVNPGAAQEAFANLARQKPALIIGGGSELTDGLIPVSQDPAFADTTFVMVAGAPPSTDSYASVGANENQAHYLGGVAMGMLLKRTGATTGCIVAGPELAFVQNMDKSMHAGLASVDPSYKILVTYTGDFENTVLAQEAVTAQINQGCKYVYPYLGGALTAVLDTAHEAGIGLVSTSVDRCADPSLPFAMSILYNPALYLEKVIAAFKNGEIVEGKQFALYGAGDGVGIGAKICDATADEAAAIASAEAKLASGEVSVSDWLGS